MKKKNAFVVALTTMVLLTAMLAAVHLLGREKVAKGQLHITYQNKETQVTFDELPLQEVKGTITDAKGDKREITAQGISMKNMLLALALKSYDKVVVVAEDEYRAEVTAEEIAVDSVVYMIAQKEEGVQMLVFTDTNSKRNVSNVIRMEVS